MEESQAGFATASRGKALASQQIESQQNLKVGQLAKARPSVASVKNGTQFADSAGACTVQRRRLGESILKESEPNEGNSTVKGPNNDKGRKFGP